MGRRWSGGLRSRLSSFDHPTGRAALEAHVRSRPFNHELELFLPVRGTVLRAALLLTRPA